MANQTNGESEGDLRRFAEDLAKTGKLPDACFDLGHQLADAILVDRASLFCEYVSWAGSVVAARGGERRDLGRGLEVMVRGCEGAPDRELGARAAACLVEAIQALESEGGEAGGAEDARPHLKVRRAYLAALLDGDRNAAQEIVREQIDGGMDIRDVYRYIFEASQHDVGRMWQENRISVAQEHYCTAATQFIMSQFYPRVFSSRRVGRSVVAMCVAGEQHELGMRMVADMFEIEGWDSHYLGAALEPAGVVRAVTKLRPDVLAISVTMSSHLHRLINVIRDVRSHASCRGVQILVGGRPFRLAPDLWERVGADGSAPDAVSAVEWWHGSRVRQERAAG